MWLCYLVIVIPSVILYLYIYLFPVCYYFFQRIIGRILYLKFPWKECITRPSIYSTSRLLALIQIRLKFKPVILFYIASSSAELKFKTKTQ